VEDLTVADVSITIAPAVGLTPNSEKIHRDRRPNRGISPSLTI
jgi:hypothetical protein